jgi:HlyD family secretion protein
VLVLDRTLLDAERNIASTQLFEAEVLIARLEAERRAAEGIAFPEHLLKAAERDTGLSQNLRGEETLFDARLAAFEAQVASLERQSKGLVSQVKAKAKQVASSNEQIALLDEELASVIQLRAKGLVEESRLLALKRERSRLSAIIDEVNAAIEAQTSQQLLIALEIKRVTAARNEEIENQLREANRTAAQLKIQLDAIETRLSRLVLTAPMTGRVHDLRVTTLGSVIRPADPLLYVIPDSGAVTVTAQIDPTKIDSVRPGQEAVFKLSAFNARLTPELLGKVTLVSADALRDERTGASYYRVELAIDPGEIARLEEGQVLLPGMPVDVFISTPAQSPANYLLRPFLDYFDKALRE